MTGGQSGGQPAPAHVVLRRSISAGLAGALPLGSPLWSGIGFKLVVHVSHNAGVSLTVTVPRVRSESDPTRIETTSYSYLDGVAHATPLAMDMSSATVEPDDVRLTIGAGPIADELASLGLPTAPDFCTWGEHLSATFQLGTPL